MAKNTNPHFDASGDDDLLAFRRAVSRKKVTGSLDLPDGSRLSKRKKKRVRRIVIPFVLIIALICCYLLVAFSSIPVIAKWRGIWIETAMSTGRHHWLATSFFPASVIKDVMGDGLKTNSDVVGGSEALRQDDSSGGKTYALQNKNDDILGQKNLNVGDTDYAGNTILVNDIAEGLIISEIVSTTYRGQILLIDDPSRVFVGTTLYKNETGMRILDMANAYGAVAATNASGFNDADGNGNGGVLVGLSCSEGEMWGSYLPDYSSLVLTTDDKLVVGNIGDWSQYNIRDGIQFYPVLIANGIKQVSGSNGYGLQPRTAIAQRDDGVMAFLVIDGRQPGWSIGCTVGDMADILESYQMVNAGCCDGGASCCIAYGGELTTKNCSWNPKIGRILPNAFMVRSKNAD